MICRYGKPYGIGRLLDRNGNVFEGTIDDQLLCGTLTFKKGLIESYMGYLKRGVYSGEGDLLYKNGDRFQGTFSNGKKLQGLHTFAEGPVASYEGFWQNELFNGQGVLRRRNGDRYEGSFDKDLMHGDGMCTFKHGRIASYNGSWLNNMRHEGIMVCSNGDTYDGAFLDDKKSGEGKYTYKRGAVKSFDGVWEDDQYVSGVLLRSNGDSYNGQFQNRKFHGQGVFTQFRDDMSYSGGWRYGERDGDGKITLGNAGTFKDVFRDDEAMCGSGAEYTDNTGIISTGNAAVQLAREHGAESFLPRSRKRPRRYEPPTGSSGKNKQKKQKTTTAATTVAAAAVAEPELSDHDEVDISSDLEDDYIDIDDNNIATDDADTNALNDTNGDDTPDQGCIYAYTVPTDGGSSDGKTLYSIGAYNTCDRTALIDYLEATIDTSAGNYETPLVLACAQGKQQQLLRKMCNVLIGLGRKDRTSSEGRFMTTADVIMRTYITCNGGHVNL
jgi:hypothetical protein